MVSCMILRKYFFQIQIDKNYFLLLKYLVTTLETESPHFFLYHITLNFESQLKFKLKVHFLSWNIFQFMEHHHHDVMGIKNKLVGN